MMRSSTMPPSARACAGTLAGRRAGLQVHLADALGDRAALVRISGQSEVRELDQRVARAGHALVELDDDLAHRGRRRSRSRIASTTSSSVCRSSEPSGWGTPSSANRRRQPVLVPRGASRGSAPYMGMPRLRAMSRSRLGRVVRDEVAARPVRDRARRSARAAAVARAASRSAAGASVADRDHRQPGGVARDDAGQQREVVLDDARGDRRRRDVHHPQAWLAEQQQQEEESLLVGLGQAAALALRRSAVTDGMTTTDSSSRLRRIAPTPRQVALEPFEALRSAAPRRRGPPGSRLGPCPAGRFIVTVRPLSTPFTSNALTGPAEPLQLEIPDRLAGDEVLGPESTRCVTRICPAGRFRAQPRGEVRHAADRGVVEAPLEADPAQRGVALRDADAEAEIVAPAAPALRPARRPGRAWRRPSDRALGRRRRTGSGR